jgi:CheY-like chemotaxis protein
MMSTSEHERILIVDDNHIFRETLAQRLRDAGYQVTTAETGERAFFALRDWSRPIDWLYTRANLPSLIDGWILADEYHDNQKGRAVIIAASESRVSQQGDIILKQPSVTTVLDTLRHTTETDRAKMAAAHTDASHQRRAA